MNDKLKNHRKEKIIAIIPARSGSKGLKDKNIKILVDKPLIAYTIEAAKESKIFEKIVISTDSQEIAKIAKQFGAEVPFIRPNELAMDESSTIDVVFHCLNFFQKDDYDVFCLLQPTSPLRSYEDIINSYRLFQEKKANAVISVCEMEHSPVWSNLIGEDLRIDHFIKKSEINKRRQEFPTYYRVNGAIYFSKIEYFFKYRYFYEKDCFAYIMPQDRSIDIDNILDFKLAELLLKEKMKSKKKKVSKSL